MILFFLLGAAVGFIGTALGLGGGIMLTPVLLYLYPQMKPEEVTSISLFCIALNASIGSVSYILKKKTHLPSAILFSIASLPGAWLGVQLVSRFQRDSFEFVFAIFLTLVGLFLVIRKPKVHIDADMAQWNGSFMRYSIAFVASFFVGVIASFLGIGGGIIHVPLLSETMLFPAHTAIATSQFILAVSAIVASIEHYLNGSLNLNQSFVFYIAAGILIGSPIGAKISGKVRGSNIMRLIGVVVLIVALRLLYVNFSR